MKKYAIIGYPVKQSLSPSIHNPAFKKLGLDAHYERIEIAPGTFEKEVTGLKKGNAYSGFNITVPYKQNIIPFLDDIDDLAEKVGAVNTIDVKGGRWTGYNTDCHGFILPIKDILHEFKNVLLIGAGGAARAAAFSLLAKAKNLDSLLIWNRTQSNAEKLANELKQYSDSCTAIPSLTQLPAVADLIVNCTSVGMGKDGSFSPFSFYGGFHNNTIVYDLIYYPAVTAFLSEAGARGLKTINGLEMLAGQGISAFKLWTGKQFPFSLQETIISLQEQLKKRQL